MLNVLVAGRPWSSKILKMAWVCEKVCRFCLENNFSDVPNENISCKPLMPKADLRLNTLIFVQWFFQFTPFCDLVEQIQFLKKVASLNPLDSIFAWGLFSWETNYMALDFHFIFWKRNVWKDIGNSYSGHYTHLCSSQ